ncbi:hypothetical protein [Streptomyces sp. Pv4-95]|uniref:hypothetical protein n=1 Tax=Streptomyces sp. Pv4-95 TaxID=3049543 RepID=UPI003892C239
MIRLNGETRTLMTGERTALNFLQLFCGIAALTKRYVDLVGDLGVQVLDTRNRALTYEPSPNAPFTPEAAAVTGSISPR